MKFKTFLHLSRFHTYRAHDDINPFVPSEMFPAFEKFIQIKTRQLNRFEIFYVKGVIIFVNVVVAYYNFGPNTPLSQKTQGYGHPREVMMVVTRLAPPDG